MEKLQRDIKNLVDHVPVPKSKLDETVQAALLTASKEKKLSFNKKNHVIVSIASIFVLAIGGLLFNSYYPEFEALLTQSPETSGTSQQSMEAIPYTESIFYHIGDEGLKRMAIEGRTEKLLLESEDQGIKVILEEGYLDSQQMAISFSIGPTSEMEVVKEISMDLFINGIPKPSHIYNRLNTKELVDHGNIFVFQTLDSFTDQSKIDVNITSINHVEGNWSFTFDLQKEEEYITKFNISEKVDRAGNVFSVNSAFLTPSLLKLDTRTSITLNEAMPNYSFLHMSIVAPGPNGIVYLSESSRQSSNNDNAYDQIISGRTITEFLEIPRESNSYSYKIVPYIATYNGESVDEGKGFIWDEITTPFRQDTILKTESMIKIQQIKDEQDATVVYYEMDLNPSLPIFPMIKNRRNNEYYYAISYKLLDDYVEVTYPKLENPEFLEFLMYDAEYKVFSDLEIELDLN